MSTLPLAPEVWRQGDFSADDSDSFKKVGKLKEEIAFYLMSPYREIRYALIISVANFHPVH